MIRPLAWKPEIRTVKFARAAGADWASAAHAAVSLRPDDCAMTAPADVSRASVNAFIFMVVERKLKEVLKRRADCPSLRNFCEYCGEAKGEDISPPLQLSGGSRSRLA